MSLQSILVLAGLAAVLAGLVVWIAKQGGWQDTKCGGDCRNCMSGCDQREQPPRED